LDNRAKDYEEAADGGTGAATEEVSDVGGEEEDGEAAEAREGTYEAETGARGVVED
jgi:hypothetical protein